MCACRPSAASPQLSSSLQALLDEDTVEAKRPNGSHGRAGAGARSARAASLARTGEVQSATVCAAYCSDGRLAIALE
eukprot:9808751-Alexandrium_andersonii.AAC.1